MKLSHSWWRKVAVTVSMDGLDFHAPMHVGEVAILEARVLEAFCTSLEVGVTVRSENLITGSRKLCTTALLTFVAIDENGRPVEVPPLAPETDAEKRVADEAAERRRLRLARRHPMS